MNFEYGITGGMEDKRPQRTSCKVGKDAVIDGDAVVIGDYGLAELKIVKGECIDEPSVRSKSFATAATSVVHAGGNRPHFYSAV